MLMQPWKHERSAQHKFNRKLVLQLHFVPVSFISLILWETWSCRSMRCVVSQFPWLSIIHRMNEFLSSLSYVENGTEWWYAIYYVRRSSILIAIRTRSRSIVQKWFVFSLRPNSRRKMAQENKNRSMDEWNEWKIHIHHCSTTTSVSSRRSRSCSRRLRHAIYIIVIEWDCVCVCERVKACCAFHIIYSFQSAYSCYINRFVTSLPISVHSHRLSVYSALSIRPSIRPILWSGSGVSVNLNGSETERERVKWKRKPSISKMQK